MDSTRNSDLESSVADSEYLIARFEAGMKAWRDLTDPAVAVDMYRRADTYSLDTLKLDSVENINGGGFGKIFKGTLIASQGERFQLNRGSEKHNHKWHLNPSLFNVSGGDQKVITVAIKKIDTEEAEQEKVVEVLREACNVRVLHGTRNVVNVYGVTRNSDLNSVCIVMELVEGPHGDLSNFLKSHGPGLKDPSWWKTKLEIFMELVVGVKACHQSGVYHGDLKGSNVVLDSFCTPKLVDFGFSFRRKDVDYLNSLGGSLFWMSPEVADWRDDPEAFKQVRDHPFPSDVYSLGMLWIEMLLDGFIPEEKDEVEKIWNNKKYEGCPVDDLQVPSGLEESSFQELLAMVDGCCMDTERRFSLEQCLHHAQAAYGKQWNYVLQCDDGANKSHPDLAFITLPEYMDMLKLLRERFPNVLDAFVEQPSKNMVVDIDGDTLLYLFCEIDFRLGVEYIMDRAGVTWCFNVERDVPRLCGICVRSGSPAVLHFLASKWRNIVVQEEWLLHEACDGQCEAVMSYLLHDLGMDFDTWHKSSNLKPLHRMAHQGNTIFMRILLDYVQQPDYVNVALFSSTPLSYAIEGDKVEAVMFLLERGGTLGSVTSANEPEFLRELFYHAMGYWSLTVMTAFLELDIFLDDEGSNCQGPRDLNHGLMNSCCTPKVVHMFRHMHHIEPQHRDFLPLLSSFVKTCRMQGVEAFGHACSRHGDRNVFKLIMSHWKDPARHDRVEDRLWRSLGADGSREMVEFAFQKVDFDGWSFSCLARAARCNAEVLAFLTEMGKLPHTIDDDVEEEEESHGTPYQRGELEEAIEKGDTDLMFDRLHSLLLYEEGFRDVIASLDLNQVINIQGGVGEKLRMLINELKNIEEWTDLGQAMMAESAFKGEKAIVELLINEGGVVLDGLEYYHDEVSTPLIQAVACGDYEMVELLLRAGASPNARTGEETAMDIAVRCGNKRIVQLLIDKGFNMGMRDRNNAAYIDRVTYMTSRKHLGKQ